MSVIGVIRDHKITLENVELMSLITGKKSYICESCKGRCKTFTTGYSAFGCCKTCLELLKQEVLLIAKRSIKK